MIQICSFPQYLVFHNSYPSNFQIYFTYLLFFVLVYHCHCSSSYCLFFRGHNHLHFYTCICLFSFFVVPHYIYFLFNNFLHLIIWIKSILLSMHHSIHIKHHYIAVLLSLQDFSHTPSSYCACCCQVWKALSSYTFDIVGIFFIDIFFLRCDWLCLSSENSSHITL